MNKINTVAISSIGSGIGQSVINSLRLSPIPFRTVGFGNGDFEYGALDCDLHENVPPIHDPDYVDVLIEKCLEYSVDIIIPGLDIDVLAVSTNAAKFNQRGIAVLTSEARLVSLCRNKEKMTNQFHTKTEHFVVSYNKTNFQRALKQGKILLPCIAKPRGGSGSIGVKLIRSEDDFHKVPDNIIFQELLLPSREDYFFQDYIKALEEDRLSQFSELSIQYVVGREGEFIGKLATINKLKNGVPIEIFPINKKEIWDAVDAIIPHLAELGLRGPVNIQGRITDQGIKFFEVNPRFTGITGLRAMMGFNEVEECIKNWLGYPSSKPPFQGRTRKFGIRQVADKAALIVGHQPAENYYTYLNPTDSLPQETLLITGCTGYLGRNLLKALDRNRYQIWALTSDIEKARELIADQVDCLYSWGDIQSGNISWGRVDTLIHCGFARPYRSSREIADSLAFTEDLFHYVGKNAVHSIINISSQSVYGQAADPPWKEDTPVSPESPYAAAKFASELMLQSEKRLNPHINITSLRLAGLTGGQIGLVPIDLISRFVQQALDGSPIEIRGRHRFERLDVRDAVGAINKLLLVPAKQWKEVYNLGQGETFSIEELAREVIKQVSLVNTKGQSPLVENLVDDSLNFGMDSSAFYHDTGWNPRYTLSESIQSLINHFDEGR